MPERKIHFYRAHVGIDDAGEPIPFNPHGALNHINGLPFTEQGRYLADGDDAITCWVDGPNPRRRFRIGQVRRTGLPMVEQAGNLSDLRIPANSGLVETIHVIVFPANIVGSDFNFYGPRMSRVSHYLEQKGGGLCPSVTFEPLLRRDITEALQRLEDIRVFHLKIRASYAQVVAQANQNLGAAFQAAANAGDADELEIVLRPRRYTREPLAIRLKRVALRLAGRNDIRTEASKFEVRGLDEDTGRVEIVDVLRDQLIARRQISHQSDRGRALDTNSAYAAITSAYDEMRNELNDAATIAP